MMAPSAIVPATAVPYALLGPDARLGVRSPAQGSSSSQSANYRPHAAVSGFPAVQLSHVLATYLSSLSSTLDIHGIGSGVVSHPANAL